MNPVSSSTEDAPATAEQAVDPTTTAARATAQPGGDDRLSHLFRASLKSGRIHPLYLPILRYRQTRDHA